MKTKKIIFIVFIITLILLSFPELVMASVARAEITRGLAIKADK